jgi:lipid-binding SYLF domain-containing protein
MTRDTLDEFTKSEGWSASLAQNVALVSKGAGDQDNTATMGKPILGFIFHEKGLLGDLSFEGSKISKIKTTD